MRIEKIESIRPEVTFPQKRNAPSQKQRKDVYDDEMDYYVEIAKASPIDREALEILLRLEVGTSLCKCLKEAFI